MAENSEDGIISLDIDEAADRLIADSQEQTDTEEATDQTEQEPDDSEEIDDEATLEAADEAEASEEDEIDQADDDNGSDEVEEADEAELFIELDGEDVSVSELKRWKQEGMLQADYTRKRQADAEARKALDAELEQTQQLKAQLQDKLATFALPDQQEPNWAELNQKLTPQEFNAQKMAWEQHQAQKQQAAEQFRLLQDQNFEETRQRETAALLEQVPKWSDPNVFNEDLAKMTKVAADLGFNNEEIEATVDHRMFRVLDLIVNLQARVDGIDKSQASITKKVIKAKPKLPAGAKPAKSQESDKARRLKKARLRDTGSIDDALAYLME